MRTTHCLQFSVLGTLRRDYHLPIHLLCREDLCVQLELETLLGQRILELLSESPKRISGQEHRRFNDKGDARNSFIDTNTSNVFISSTTVTSELCPNTPPDNSHDSLYVLERECASRADKLLFIYFNGATWEWCNLGPGCSDDILRFYRGLAALVGLHRNRIRRHDEAVPLV